MSENINRLSGPMRALLLSLACGSTSILCGNSACDPVGGYNAPDQGGEKDMAQTPQDMETTQDMETMQDMETTDMFSEEDMSVDFGQDMPDLADPMSCERVADCETGQQNVIASCDGTGLCSYQCTSDSWAVTDGENITVDGCTCTVNEEICDNRDNDCDTQIDEDLMKLCENQVGVCMGANRVCRGVASDFAKECEEADYQANSTTYTTDNFENFACDGLDNDCDGYADESCCNNIPIMGESINVIVDDFMNHGIVTALMRDPRDISKHIIFTYGLSNERTIFTRTNHIKSEPAHISPSNSVAINKTTECVRDLNLEFATNNNAGETLHTIESCYDTSHKIIITSTPMGSLTEETNIQTLTLDWNQNTLPPISEDKDLLFNISSNNQSVLATAWDYKENSYKLQWCLSNNPTIDCQNSNQTVNITTTNPTKPIAAVSPNGKGLIAVTNPDNNTLKDMERIVELGPTGNHIQNHDVRLPSIHGGSRDVRDHEAVWLNDEEILIVHLVHHSAAGKHTLYLAKHSTTSNTTINSSIEVDTSVDTPNEIELIVSENHVTLITIAAQNAFRYLIDAQLAISDKVHIATFPDGVGKFRHHKSDEKVIFTFLKNTDATNANSAFSYILSKEGIPICEFESGEPPMSMP